MLGYVCVLCGLACTCVRASVHTCMDVFVKDCIRLFMRENLFMNRDYGPMLRLFVCVCLCSG